MTMTTMTMTSILISTRTVTTAVVKATPALTLTTIRPALVVSSVRVCAPLVSSFPFGLPLTSTITSLNGQQMSPLMRTTLSSKKPTQSRKENSETCTTLETLMSLWMMKLKSVLPPAR